MRTGSVSVDVRDEDDERKKTTKRAIEGQEKNCAFARREKRVRPPPRRLSCFEQNGSVRTQR